MFATPIVAVVAVGAGVPPTPVDLVEVEAVGGGVTWTERVEVANAVASAIFTDAAAPKVGRDGR